MQIKTLQKIAATLEINNQPLPLKMLNILQIKLQDAI